MTRRCFGLWTENQEKLTEEQVVLEDHEDKVEELMECLEDLVVTTEPVMPHTHSAWVIIDL